VKYFIHLSISRHYIKFKLFKLEILSGEAVSYYSIVVNSDSQTLFENFIEENLNLFKSEIRDIISRLISMGKKTGAREIYFKLNEGVPGDGVCALYDNPDKKLRLYCIRYGSSLIILGGGGHKPETIRKLQECDKLLSENYLIREISKQITARIKKGEIRFSNNSNDLKGDLEFNSYEEEY